MAGCYWAGPGAITAGAGPGGRLGLERLAGPGRGEQAQAFQVVAPVEVVVAVGVVAQLTGVVLPEPHQRAAVLPGQLEPERVGRPRLVAADALPRDQGPGGLVGDPHLRVEVP